MAQEAREARDEAARRRALGIRLTPAFAALGDLLREGDDYLLLDGGGAAPRRVRFLRWERPLLWSGGRAPWQPLVTKVKPSGRLGGCCWFLPPGARLEAAPPLAGGESGMGGGDAPRRPPAARPVGDRPARAAGT